MCSFPNCPMDYGGLFGRSRLPRGFINGSLLHSSVYLYSSAIGPVRTNKTWSILAKNHSVINSVINALAYQDMDMNTIYCRGPNTTVMFYLSTMIYVKSSEYVTVHRSFPGVRIPLPSYNPANSPWFTRAPENSYSLYGPYLEEFTQQPVITLSSMKTSRDTVTGEKLTTVSAAAILISELAAIGKFWIS